MENNPNAQAESRTVKDDCRWYRGHVPCQPHKTEQAVCSSCTHYEALGERILIIKLGAVGDVIRTTPLLRKLKAEIPTAEITWLTYAPEVVPHSWVDRVLKLGVEALVWLQSQRFDWLINLDKEPEAIALTEQIRARRKSGFGMSHFGKCVPLDGSRAAEDKWQTGLWDDLNKANTLNYMQEMFAVCGFSFEGERYLLELSKDLDLEGFQNLPRPLIGLNTGCGKRWLTRLWSRQRWIELIGLLSSQGYGVVLLGGPDEDPVNRELSGETEAAYLGTRPLQQFFGMIDRCDVLVTQVTMALHVAIARSKPVVLLNNIFNRNEFDLYGRGRIIEPPLGCLGCFKQRFDAMCPTSNCMDLISAEDVFQAVREVV